MNQQSATMQKPDKTPAYAWVILIALYMATLSATLNLFKLPPVMTIIQEAFTVDIVKVGGLMSVFSIMGFILAIPAGYILKRIGIKMTALISVGAVTIGSALGALAKTFAILYAGRFIEGVGMGLIMVTAPLAISVWFPLHNRALPTGLWASSVGIGNIIMLLCAPSLAVLYKWQSVWWICAGFSALSFILFAALFRLPKQGEMGAEPAPAPATQEEAAPSLAKGMANLSFWMIGIAFGCYNLVAMAIVSFYPTFLDLRAWRSHARIFCHRLYLWRFNLHRSRRRLHIGSFGQTKDYGSYSIHPDDNNVPLPLYGDRIVDPVVCDCIRDCRRPSCRCSSRGCSGGGEEASIHRDRHVCSNLWPEYRDVYQRSAFSPDTGSSGMGSRGVLDDSCMLNRHYCNLINQGSIKSCNNIIYA
jgi:hypothetical protein